MSQTCPSLLYHHVGPLRSERNRDLTVTPERFERQIRWLARKGYTGITPSDWLNWLREGKRMPPKPILLTFDDAYADTAQYGLPILRQYGFRAAVFVVTKQLGGTNAWDEAQGRDKMHLMNAEQIRYWAGQGTEFGAHSRTHPHLTQISPAELTAEVAGSKSDMAAVLGQAPISFAYPYGDCNGAVREAVGEEFQLAFSVEEGLNDASTDPHLLRRSYIGPTDSMAEFALCVRRGGMGRLRHWRVKLALRTRIRRALGRG